jgi:alpha-D-ribose 1-methylphosphonate 5-triphosphate synthase subunit PhnL
MQPILKVDGLTKHFQLHDQGKLIPSCADVRLEVHAGQLTALTGPTGAGKSSVLKCIYRTYLPSAGRILYCDASGHTFDLALASEHQMLGLRGGEIGFVTQFMHCLPRKSALDVVSAPLVGRGSSRESAHDKAADLLTRLNVPERLWGLPPATFSGGEKQRVNLARGLIARPRLLLLDEPTASLDQHTTDRVVDLLQSIKSEGVAMLAIFHHPELVARLTDRVVELARPVAITELLENCTS